MEPKLEDIAKSLGINIVDEPSQQFSDTTSDNTLDTNTADVQDAAQPDAAPDQTQDNTDDNANTQVDTQTQDVDSGDTSADTQTSSDDDDDLTEDEINSFVFQFLSEKLGKEITSIDELSQTPQSDIDERVAAINKFVKETGKNPEDWFTYQSMNTSEMDDLAAVKINLATEYPSLSDKEIDLLISSKYKLDEDKYDDTEVQYSKLQLKIDAEKAKREIESIRASFAAPAAKTETSTSKTIFSEEWMDTMGREVQELESIEFELSKDKTFKFGVTDDYKKVLKQKNQNLDGFFNQYVKKDGSWDFETMHSHFAVLDNIDSIIKSVYQQGMSDGQRRVVDTAANVSVGNPNPSNVSNGVDHVRQQIMNAIGADDIMKFKI